MIMPFCILRKIWDAESGNELLSFPHKHIVKSVDFSKDSSKLLTGSNEKLIRVYDLNSPEAGRRLSISNYRMFFELLV